MSVHLFVFGSYIERWRGDSFSGATFDDGSEPSLQYAGCAAAGRDRKSTRLNSSHSQISYAVFCLKKKNEFELTTQLARALKRHDMILSSQPDFSLVTRVTLIV